MKIKISLTDMNTGETGKVMELLGGFGLVNRLKSLGIRPGVNIKKISSSFFHGPVVLQIGNNQTALGHGISHKIIIEVER